MQRTHATAAPQHPLSRRAFVGIAAGGLALALGGCSGAGTESGSSVEGLASDTVQKSSPVALKVYVDEALQWQASPYEGHDTRLDYLAAAYQERVLATVSFEFEYVDFFELEQLTLEGFEDGDAVIAQSDVVTAGGVAGTLECGEQDYMVRELGFHLSDKCILVRAAGTEDQLPEAVMPARANSAKPAMAAMTATTSSTASSFSRLERPPPPLLAFFFCSRTEMLP